MNVLHIAFSDKGGAGIAAVRLHKALLQCGIDSHMLLLNSSEKIMNTHTYLAKSKNIITKIIHLLIYKAGLERSYGMRNFRKLINFNEENGVFSFATSDIDITNSEIFRKADIINLHWVAGFLDFNFFRKNTKPVIWTLHDQNPFTGGCHYSQNCRLFQTNCEPCFQLKETGNEKNAGKDLRYKKDQLSNATIHFVALSNWLLGLSQSSSLFKGYPHHLIPNSIDLKPLDDGSLTGYRKIFGLSEQKKILLFVSASLTDKRKGMDLLAEACGRLKNPEILICALGEKHEEINIPIQYLPPIDDERLITALYSCVDAVVIPSREDNLPNVMLESLACGTPVIAFAIGGMPDVIQTGFNGILARELSSEALAEAINDFMNNKYNFDRPGIRKFIVDHFSPATQAESYRNLYENVLNKK